MRSEIESLRRIIASEQQRINQLEIFVAELRQAVFPAKTVAE